MVGILKFRPFLFINFMNCMVLPIRVQLWKTPKRISDWPKGNRISLRSTCGRWQSSHRCAGKHGSWRQRISIVPWWKHCICMGRERKNKFDGILYTRHVRISRYIKFRHRKRICSQNYGMIQKSDKRIEWWNRLYVKNWVIWRNRIFILSICRAIKGNCRISSLAIL
mgnify:CR=1 FL=1